MPGHKQGRVNPLKGYDFFKMDLTETDMSDDLFHPKAYIKESLDRAKNLYKTLKTYYLVNGSSSGLMTAISACTKRGDQILIQRNSHHAVYNGVYANGLDPLYIYPSYNEELGLFGGINPDNLRQLLITNPDIKAVVITSPSYEGLILDIEMIAGIVHEYNKILIVDEAHGAHLFFYDFTPDSALAFGADIVVQSLHKTLPALTQTALLHINSNCVDIDIVDFYYQMYQTSSPSFVLVASIDSCINYMTSRSLAKQMAYKEMLFNFRNQIKQLEHIGLIDDAFITRLEKSKPMYIKAVDPTRLTFIGKKGLLDGKGLDEALQTRFKLVFEMASLNYIVGISSLADTLKGFGLLYDSIELIGAMYCVDEKSSCQTDADFGIIKVVDKVMKPSDAADYDVTEIELDQAEGRICSDYIKVYPPSIPILVPGERITRSMINYIKQLDAFVIHGITDNKLKVLQ
jgi:arginine decarboxylase